MPGKRVDRHLQRDRRGRARQFQRLGGGAPVGERGFEPRERGARRVAATEQPRHGHRAIVRQLADQAVPRRVGVYHDALGVSDRPPIGTPIEDFGPAGVSGLGAWGAEPPQQHIAQHYRSDQCQRGGPAERRSELRAGAEQAHVADDNAGRHDHAKTKHGIP